MSVCLPLTVPFIDQQISSLYSNITTSLINPVKSVREFNLLEAVICRPSILPKKSSWSGSSMLPSTLRPKDALVYLMANSTLGIIIFFIAVNTASWFLVWTVVISLSTSLRTLLPMFSSSVCISTCGPLIWTGLIILFQEAPMSNTLVSLPAWVSWLLCLIFKSVT